MSEAVAVSPPEAQPTVIEVQYGMALICLPLAAMGLYGLSGGGSISRPGGDLGGLGLALALLVLAIAAVGMGTTIFRTWIKDSLQAMETGLAWRRNGATLRDIPWSAIRSVRRLSINFNDMMEIRHDGGTAPLHRSAFRMRRDYETITAEIERRTGLVSSRPK